MKTVLAAIVLLSTVGQAAAQTVITVRPRGNDLTIDNGYVGPYGPDLPGVALFRGWALPVAPDIYNGGVKLPSDQKMENEQLVEHIYGASQVPYLDAWHGTVGEGLPF
jgi:hypothetical protein